jgi:chromosome segregation ATPase
MQDADEELPDSGTDSTSDRRRISQERNRLAAVKSRLKKKQEWYRLVESEQALRQENDILKRRIKELESKLAEASPSTALNNPSFHHRK